MKNPAYEENKTNEGVQARRERDAAERKCTIIYPKENELFVDIDSFYALGVFHANIGGLGDLVSSRTIRPSPSRKAGRYHAVVTLTRPVKDHFERIMLQLLLGSDHSREICSFKRAMLGLEEPTVFFEKPLTDEVEKSPADEVEKSETSWKR